MSLLKKLLVRFLSWILKAIGNEPITKDEFKEFCNVSGIDLRNTLTGVSAAAKAEMAEAQNLRKQSTDTRTVAQTLYNDAVKAAQKALSASIQTADNLDGEAAKKESSGSQKERIIKKFA